MYLEQPAKHRPKRLETEEELNAQAAAWPELGGSCGYCDRIVSNEDEDGIHRVTPILEGGRGVECKLRGDW